MYPSALSAQRPAVTLELRSPSQSRLLITQGVWGTGQSEIISASSLVLALWAEVQGDDAVVPGCWCLRQDPKRPRPTDLFPSRSDPSGGFPGCFRAGLGVARRP